MVVITYLQYIYVTAATCRERSQTSAARLLEAATARYYLLYVFSYEYAMSVLYLECELSCVVPDGQLSLERLANPDGNT